MKYLKGICLILSAWLFASCAEHIVYHSYKHIPKTGWSKSDTLVFQLHITDSMPQPGNVVFLIRNQSDYLYQDFRATVSYNIPDTAQWTQHDLSVRIADKDGKWKGSGWGGLYQSAVTLNEMYIPAGTYTFRVVHDMKDEFLPGISDVGILIKK